MLDIYIRWTIRRDMPEVLEIERASFVDPWTEEDFLSCLRQRNCIGMVAEEKATGRIVGFMIYELSSRKVEVVNMATHPGFLRMGVASQMVAKLQAKLSAHRRNHIRFVVSEHADPCHHFLKSMGFQALKILRGEDGQPDDYLFVYRVPSPIHSDAQKA